ncbi:MAG: FKBP-type peptidyl-prolyl cis-trans isomerase [Candidatus Pacebacteria bacterium]|nr:FKBP-type peptidyl-prolyl cis-trans isomerase [Candidatus Paceibacterota bacterium]MBP9839509.1 FKBP-type peptidyl-prolyl cis-trans isomerase [Candidatus Paceibacterota bacterium]
MEEETIVQVAKAGDKVSMNYTGRLEDGTVFDSNVDPKFNHVEPFVFKLGAGQVIAGWDKGIVGMKVGEKKTLEIEPADGYGATGVPGVIPANAKLIFDVELVGIVNNVNE